MSNTNLSDYLGKDIFELLGLKDITEEEKQELSQIMEETVKNRTIARLVDSLNDEEMETWDTLETDDEKMEFLSKRDISLAQIILEEAMLYKAEILELLKIMREKAKKD